MPRISPTVVLGKTIRRVARLRGGGSALPGLVVERLQPDFLKMSLGQLPKGIVIVTGTNGKTTTTKMITELLESQGLKVLTNRTGSNFTRGIVASVLEHMNYSGVLDYDIAVIELDEAYAKRFVEKVQPTYVVALNVMRDQLDRFGELDTVAKLLAPVMQAASTAVVVNSDDPLLLPIAADEQAAKKVVTFGVDASLRHLFPTDDEIQSRSKTPKNKVASDVTLAAIDGQHVSYRVGRSIVSATLKLRGSYNFQNAGAALALTRIITGASPEQLIKQLAEITPAFGRGEKLTIHGQPVEIVLVKNPAGFRLSLSSFNRPDHDVMIAINDAYADGRDMSWLWDVDFGSLQERTVGMVSGHRAHDMALRLQYDEVLFSAVEPDIDVALKAFIESSSRPKIIFCSYTAMLALRRSITRFTEVERVL